MLLNKGETSSPAFYQQTHTEQHSMGTTNKSKAVESEKIIAERINGWAAMIGFWAAIGAYLTTGQIIPGIV